MTINELSRRANQAAAALGHPSLSTEHFVLALLDDASRDSAAGRALRACGVTYERFASDLAERTHHRIVPAGEPPAENGRFLGADAGRVLARAEGIAVGLGFAAVGPEHVLAAVIWDPVSPLANQILERSDATRERLLEELERTGARIPQAPLPRIPRWSDWRAVSEDDFDQLTAELRSAGVLHRSGRKEGQIFVSIAEETSEAG